MTRLAASAFLALSVAVSVWCFRGIVHRYQTLLGFPWLLSVGFAAAAAAAVFALHALINP